MRFSQTELHIPQVHPFAPSTEDRQSGKETGCAVLSSCCHTRVYTHTVLAKSQPTRSIPLSWSLQSAGGCRHEVCACVLSHFSHVQLLATLWTVAHQDPLSMRFFRQEYWSGLPCPPPGDFPNPEIKPMSLTSPALAGGFSATSTTWGA